MSEMELELDKLTQFDEKCAEHNTALIAFQSFWRDALLHGIELPYDASYGTSHYSNIAEFHYDENREYVLDAEATQKQFARVVKWARSRGWTVEKRYKDDEFAIIIEGIPEPIGYMEFYSTRQVLCKRVVTGKKIIPAQPEREEDETEWVCEKVAFLTVEID